MPEEFAYRHELTRAGCLALHEVGGGQGEYAGEDVGAVNLARHRVAGGQFRVPGAQFVVHRGELGDAGPVTGVGVGEQGHAAVAGDDRPEPDQAQVGALGLALPRWAMGALPFAVSM
ncbi:hypothetical protein [Streptomyces canus]|uniref:hypothetical protein n=1 Tax=Streptomyces canus TaxID=58343 RepID=UPI00371EE537